jgi:hypothetical protein
MRGFGQVCASKAGKISDHQKFPAARSRFHVAVVFRVTAPKAVPDGDLTSAVHTVNRD